MSAAELLGFFDRLAPVGSRALLQLNRDLSLGAGGRVYLRGSIVKNNYRGRGGGKRGKRRRMTRYLRKQSTISLSTARAHSSLGEGEGPFESSYLELPSSGQDKSLAISPWKIAPASWRAVSLLKGAARASYFAGRSMDVLWADTARGIARIELFDSIDRR